MPRKQANPRARGAVTDLSRIGNLGCIRFPKSLRACSGIKRGDRLLVQVVSSGAIRLEKVELAPGEGLPPGFAETLTVEACVCETPPESCRARPPEVVTVGWSYVQLSPDFASELGFLPNTPIELVATPSVIAVTRHEDDKETQGIGPVTCPP